MNAPLSVIGRQNLPGYVLPVCVSAQAAEPAQPDAPRFAICLIHSGSATVTLNGQRLLLGAPAVLLLDDRERPQLDRTQGLAIETVYFHPGIINSAFTLENLHGASPGFSGTLEYDFYLLQPLLPPDPARRILKLSPQQARHLRQLVANIANEAASQPDQSWPCRTRSWLFELLFCLRAANQAANQAATLALPSQANRLDDALLLVHERYHTRFTIAELARWCGSNRTSLNVHFRNLTGASVHDYVIRLRMDTAAALLRDTLLPVGEIMTRVGYENPSHFSRIFRQFTGSTPRDYRTAHNWM
ncbi:helix-turn-helix domain-containing protein [Chitiniphilus eburneus]|nr:AraC family transcriptional regulator [Chitiniphilus eburneus]